MILKVVAVIWNKNAALSRSEFGWDDVGLGREISDFKFI
jgi:hypothetical protein